MDNRYIFGRKEVGKERGRYVDQMPVHDAVALFVEPAFWVENVAV